jgi:hypothetical protein
LKMMAKPCFWVNSLASSKSLTGSAVPGTHLTPEEHSNERLLV